MGITIQMRMFNNIKPSDKNLFEISREIFTYLTMLGFESKGSISSTFKENLPILWS